MKSINPPATLSNESNPEINPYTKTIGPYGDY